MQRLTDKIALVTGAAGGIGQAMIYRLAQEGTHIVAADIDTGFTADTVKTVTALGRKIETLQVDVTRQADIDRMIQHTVDAMGRLDILMNNAGVIRFQDILDISPDDWDFVCDVNVKGAFFVLQATARQMIAQGDGGKIGDRLTNPNLRFTLFTDCLLPFNAANRLLLCDLRGLMALDIS